MKDARPHRLHACSSTASRPRARSARWTASTRPGRRAHPEGFSDADIAALRRLVPALGLAVKSAALARIAGTLVDVYLGRDAGQRVLSGRIQRGVADRIDAVLWFSDLRSFTTITDTARARRDHPAAQRLCRRGDHRHPRGRRRRAEADRRRHAGDLPRRRSGHGLRPGAQGRSRHAPPRRTSSMSDGGREERPTTLGLCRPACRRGVLRQYRQRRPARLHRGRPGRQRDQPHRLDVPLGRSAGADFVRVRRRRCRTPSVNISYRSAGSLCAASAARKELFTLDPGLIAPVQP